VLERRRARQRRATAAPSRPTTSRSTTRATPACRRRSPRDRRRPRRRPERLVLHAAGGDGHRRPAGLLPRRRRPRRAHGSRQGRARRDVNAVGINQTGYAASIVKASTTSPTSSASTCPSPTCARAPRPTTPSATSVCGNVAYPTLTDANIAVTVTDLRWREFFDDALEQLIDALPGWWAKDRATAASSRILLRRSPSSSTSSPRQLEGIYADQALADRPRRGAAHRVGAAVRRQPRRPPAGHRGRCAPTCRPAPARTARSAASRRRCWRSARHPENDTGTELVFPAGGAGLTFPADGSGLTMFEPPPSAATCASPPTAPACCSPPTGPGSSFPTSSRLEITEDFADSSLDVTVRNYLVFDRPAFARAVARFRQAHHGLPHDHRDPELTPWPASRPSPTVAAACRAT
jgi:hypothetical protein